MDGFHRDSLDDGLLPDGFEHEFEAFARALDQGSGGRRCVADLSTCGICDVRFKKADTFVWSSRCYMSVVMSLQY